MASPHSTALPRYLAIAYAILIIYASLHPFSGWRDPVIPILSFLESDWPRYWTVFDLVINALAYAPLGFLLTLAFQRRINRWLAAVCALLLGGGLSLALECGQTWLPARVPSNLDLACNILGAGLGAIFALLIGENLFGHIRNLQRFLLAPEPHAEAGLVMLGLWLLTQLSPETQLFGTGDLRSWLALTPLVPYDAHSFFIMETSITACNMIAVGLMARTLMSGRVAPYLVTASFFVLALGVHALAAAALVAPGNALVWLTPGAKSGLLIGALALAIMLLSPPSLRLALAGLALMAGTVLVNLTPPNPYSEAALATWRQGHFLNFNGLTRLVAMLWPFIALPYLTLLGRRI